MTRPHEDLDLVTWVQYRQSLERALAEVAFDRMPVSDRQTNFRKGNVDIQFLYVTRSREENIIPNGRPEWVWRADSLPLKLFTLNGISVFVLSPEVD
ncbi:nucleotidyltransferase domain-containing protein [Paenibacillus thiaminolyticus]|uniref:nucleotidyltransferase domain-containing protein n=1 Tax=Paenibacillus thiaminolyticus TaxID=49283 RepID=UPI003D2D3A31